MNEDDKAAALAGIDAAASVPCPECSAAAGERCVMRDTGQRSSIIHRARAAAWDKVIGPVRLAEAAAEAFERRK